MAREILREDKKVWLLVAAVVIGFNLRPALSSVGPLVEFVQLPWQGWDEIGAGLLVSIPLVLFASATPILWRLLRRWRLWDVTLVALSVLTLAILARSFMGAPGLLVGTVTVGLSIGILNVALPVYVRKWAADGAKAAMNFYTASLSIGAAVAAGATVPVGLMLNLGWQEALSVWAITAGAAMVFWFFTKSKLRPRLDASPEDPRDEAASGIGTSVAALVIFFGSQSLLYYTTTTWLPALLVNGSDAVQNGYLLSIINWAGIPAAFLAPYLCRRSGTLPLGAGIGTLLWAVGLFLLLFTSHSWVGSVVVGLAQGTTLSFGLGMIVVRSRTHSHSVMVSGVVQGFGYVLAAAGPVAAGAILVSGGTPSSISKSLFIVVLVMFASGMVATSRVGAFSLLWGARSAKGKSRTGGAGHSIRRGNRF